MSGETIEEAKAVLRRKALDARAALNEDDRAEAARLIAGHFLHHYSLGADAVVAGYWRIRDEVDCQPILLALMDRGQKLVLPVVVGADLPLEMRLWEEGAALYEAGFGTLAPAEHAPRLAPDIMLVPLVGFDRAGTRLGYGGGYYDRTIAALERKPFLIGLAYDAQELDQIPRGDHDRPLDAVVTESGLRYFSAP